MTKNRKEIKKNNLLRKKNRKKFEKSSKKVRKKFEKSSKKGEMSIESVAIFYNKDFKLAYYSKDNIERSDVFRTLMKEVQAGETKLYKDEPNKVQIIIKGDAKQNFFCVVFEMEYSKNLAVEFIGNLQQYCQDSIFPKMKPNLMEDSLKEDARPEVLATYDLKLYLESLVKEYNSPGKKTKVEELKDNLAETQNTVYENLMEALNRQVQINDIAKKSARLAEFSGKLNFYKQLKVIHEEVEAPPDNSAFQRKLLKIIFITFGFLCLNSFLYVFHFCGGFQFNKCR